ncbi:hypothetical protein N7526_002795 [Penicillium atrosanguineum]|nr:hypothetical protein N7526_002795 [Penicillium atrosanguineum]
MDGKIQLAAANSSACGEASHHQRILEMFPFPVAGQIILAIIALIIWRFHRCKWFIDIHEDVQKDVTSAQHQTVEIDELENFHLDSSEPPKFRPFKPKYHLTMGLETLGCSDFLIFDKTYPERLKIRRSLVQQHPEDVIGIISDSDARIRLAVEELYSHLFKIYLPARYPSIFKTTRDKTDHINSVENLITGSIIPADAESISLHVALKIISENIDEDFFILLPHKTDEDTPGDVVYVLEAYSACFPSGFQPRDKIGKRLADIHRPVPKYKEKLQKSMDRFFARLEAGRLVKRVNWAVTVDEELYSNFDKSGPAFEGTLKKMTMKDLDLNKTFLRSERQTLHRLPASDAIVFAFHTYLYPIQDIKAEGSGEDLALAIDGLQSGSVPEIFTYKNGEKWADAVKQYLRS